LAFSYGQIAKIAAQFSHGLVNSAMGQIPCSTERISCFLKKGYQQVESAGPKDGGGTYHQRF